jgi:esterase/lipase superfamily enzyme
VAYTVAQGMLLLRTGGFGDAVPLSPLASFFKAVTSALEAMGRQLSRFEKLLWTVISVALGYLAVRPLFQDQFSFADVFRSRLLLAAAPLALLPIVLDPFFSRFNLRWFQIDRGPRRRFFLRSRTIAYLLLMALVGGLLYLIDPIGAYASARTKAVLKVFYVTDRRSETGAYGTLVFTSAPNDRMQEPERQVAYGIGTVPVGWTRWDVIRNLRSRVPLSRSPGSLSLQALTSEDFLDSVVRDARESRLQDVLVFIHGFHNSFADGINSAARLGLDLKFDGPIISYSWPAKSEVSAYLYDGEQSHWSTKHLAGLLWELVRSRDLERLNVIAHSMGNRVLAEAVADLNPKRRVFTNLIMAAADINDSNFNQDSAALTASAKRVTLYISTWDAALKVSRKANQRPRVGEEVVCRPGMDVIDTQGLGALPWTFFHDYVFESDLVLSDLSVLIQHDDLPVVRAHIQPSDDRCTWRLQPR